MGQKLISFKINIPQFLAKVLLWKNLKFSKNTSGSRLRSLKKRKRCKQKSNYNFNLKFAFLIMSFLRF